MSSTNERVRLNMWARLGIVVTGLWLLIATPASMMSQYATLKEVGMIAYRSCMTGANVSIWDMCSKNLEASIARANSVIPTMWQNAFAFSIGFAVLGWVLVGIGYVLVRWILAGRQPMDSAMA